jgi:hypothetical protein
MKLIGGYEVPDTCSDEVLRLQMTNPHPRDAQCCFSDVDHKYFIKGQSTGYTSTTGFVHQFFEAFDGEGIARRMAQREDFTTQSRYKKDFSHLFPLSVDERVKGIISVWEKGRDAGTTLHRNIELYYNGVTGIEDDSVEWRYFLNYAAKMQAEGWVPYRTEWLMYSEEYRLTGSIDMVFYHPDRGVHCVRDWKRSKKVSKYGFNKTGYYPANRLADCNLNHYALQQTIYRWFLETYYGIKVESVALVVLYPKNKDYLEIPLPDVSEVLSGMLALQYMAVNDFSKEEEEGGEEKEEKKEEGGENRFIYAEGEERPMHLA